MTTKLSKRNRHLLTRCKCRPTAPPVRRNPQGAPAVIPHTRAEFPLRRVGLIQRNSKSSRAGVGDSAHKCGLAGPLAGVGANPKASGDDLHATSGQMLEFAPSRMKNFAQTDNPHFTFSENRSFMPWPPLNGIKIEASRVLPSRRPRLQRRRTFTRKIQLVLRNAKSLP